MKGESLKGHLEMLILSILADGARHGYAIIDELRFRSDNVFDLSEGTVYPVLHRLERAGRLTSEWDGASARKRRTYRLTTAGRAKLAEDHARWKQISKAVSAVTASVGREPWPAFPTEAQAVGAKKAGRGKSSREKPARDVRTESRRERRPMLRRRGDSASE
jgi:DNA-binding PadR family transcriptional regulator